MNNNNGWRKNLNRLIEDRGKIVHDFNNLKQLALAMHNYHDVNKHFPPAVLIGPDGKTPHSWRVELLPFLDANDLYKQYRMDEPWDSENNKQVLEQIPACLRNPYDDPKSTNSGYYVLVGPGTIFEGKDGIKIQDITDGTSNTLMVVEAKRNIPWTKPDDISFNPEKPLPELGGFEKGHFATALADGFRPTVRDRKGQRPAQVADHSERRPGDRLAETWRWDDPGHRQPRSPSQADRRSDPNSE